MEGDFLKSALIFLAAAVLCVPIAKRLGMGSVLGYLIAGMLIGPYVLGFVGQEGEDIMHGAEFGVVMMLFLIGLELNPKEFWKMKKSILFLGSLQMGITAIILFIGGFFILKWPLNSAIAVALALSMSSTAIVLQTLKEKGLSSTSSGQASFSVLLFQDIAVIPILALIPLLATTSGHATDNGHSASILSELPGWLQPISVLGAIAIVFLGGKYIAVPLLRVIAKTRLREMFTAGALLLVIAVAYLMQLVELSPALGTFLAGVVLANSEYRHELESDLEPFKGLLLGLFFIGVGASLNFGLVFAEPVMIFSLVAILMIIKGVVLFITGKLSKLSSDQNLLFTFLLSQVGEFAFVLISFTNQLLIIDQRITDILMASVAVSMTITPFLLLINERIIDPRFGVKEIDDQQEADAIEEKHPVVIAGFGHFGSTIGRFLRANGIDATVLDNDSDRVSMLRKMGFKVYYGDATRYDLLKAAGLDDAKILIAAIDHPEANISLVDTVKKHFPHVKVVVRARNRYDAYELLDMGVNEVYRETLNTSVQLAVDVLKQLGIRGYQATRKAMDFLKYDEAALRKLVSYRHDSNQYILNSKKEIEIQEQLLSEDLTREPDVDHAWDSEPLKQGAVKQSN